MTAKQHFCRQANQGESIATSLFLAEQADLMLVVPMDGILPGAYTERQRYLDIVTGVGRPKTKAAPAAPSSLTDVFEKSLT